ncbi:alpha/beta fold hydrolase [Leptothrix discophora]|uniref:Alpha/beta hydrolase n=1 Tax=Leptothrix discophora TaxID=89 RepID=A0ABT9G3I2_LEPDI|nr:hypothetical protein [Leptothrix discophora]MDP4301051.1 hypothetical protein [Leptothrix discophora]
MTHLLLIFSAATVAALAALALLWAWQRHLLFPSPKRNAVLDSPGHDIVPVEVALSGKVLHGHLARPRGGRTIRSALIYFNGRREHPTSVFRAPADLPDHAVLCFHDEGMGLAWRKPAERERVANGLGALDWLARQTGLLRDRYESVRHIADVRCPCLLVIGALDTTIPPRLSRALFAGWPGRLTEQLLPDSSHRGILKRTDVHRAVGQFLGSIDAPQPPSAAP